MSQTAADFLSQFRVPLIAAPMTGVSGYDLVAAATAAGIGGSFPAHNAGSPADFERWLEGLADGQAAGSGPIVPNLVVHRSSKRLQGDLDVVCRRQVPAVITSVGSPAAVVAPLHDAGVLVFSDIASMRHAERAIEAGVDGLVLLAAGAGGQTGWANPFAFVRAVRKIWNGPVVLAGGVADGHAVFGALAAGFDLAYMGTAFIATEESAAAMPYKEAIVGASMDDIELRSDLTGIPVSAIRSDDRSERPVRGKAEYDISRIEQGAVSSEGASLFAAGHSVAGVSAVRTVADLVAAVERELRDAYGELGEKLGAWAGLAAAQ